MKNSYLKQAIPYITAFIIFITLSYIYFPAVLEGKIINQSDISSYVGASKEINDYRQKTGEEPLWTNSMFSGMPSTMISTTYKGNYLQQIYNQIFLGPRPASYLILALVSFFLLMLAMGVNVWLATIGALAFGLCAYNFQILQVGHNAKMVAIALMPLVLAALIYAYRKKALLGAVLFGFALSFEIMANHPQITFYTGMIAFAYGIAQLVLSLKNKTIARFLKTSCFILVVTLLAAGTNVNHLWPTWEYSQYTMRGGSELQMAQGNGSQTKTGLDKGYATAWSYGIEETPNLLIPNFNGGASGGELSKKSQTYQTLKQGGAPNAEEMIKQMPTYWGPQPFTAGPMYMGAICVFLFILGLILIKGVTKWWIAGISLLAVLLSWGNHFMWLSAFFFDYVPLYNKFRVPSMILTILQITVPLLGFYTLNKIFNGAFDKKTIIRAFKIALGISAGFCLLFVLIPGLAGSFTSPADQQYPDWLQQSLPADRESLLRNDALRSLFFILLSAAIVWAGYIKKISFRFTLIGLGVLLLLDMWSVDKRYLNNDHFVTPLEFNNNFVLRPVDQEILKDRDPHYRVLDLSVNTFNDSHISYFHKTIGGYSAAKLQRYQDMIDYHIAPEIQAFAKDLQQGATRTTVDSSLRHQSVLNMLNAKYIIVAPNNPPIINPSALGNAWFVQDYKIVNNPDEELIALKNIHPEQTAIIGKDFAAQVEGKIFHPDSNAQIQFISYAPNKLEYKTNTTNEQLAVFSEIYYPKGWQINIDGKPAELLRANYILRAAIIPTGEHTVTFTFEPASYQQGAMISRICSIVLIVLLMGIVSWDIRRKYLITHKKL
ncbi:MAG: YfhO family protein [Odoribacter sp.]